MLNALMAAEALKVVFDHGFEIKDENFVELTFEQYAALEGQGTDISRRWFRLTRGIFEDRNNPPDEIPIVDENEKERIVAAVQLVHDMTSRADRAFGDFRERLAWLSERLPEAITGTLAPAPSQPPTSAAKKEHFERPQEPAEGRELAGSLVFEPAGRKPVAGDLNPRRRSAPGAGG